MITSGYKKLIILEIKELEKNEAILYHKLNSKSNWFHIVGESEKTNSLEDFIITDQKEVENDKEPIQHGKINSKLNVCTQSCLHKSNPLR
jgi:hypothetical protein